MLWKNEIQRTAKKVISFRKAHLLQVRSISGVVFRVSLFFLFFSGLAGEASAIDFIELDALKAAAMRAHVMTGVVVIQIDPYAIKHLVSLTALSDSLQTSVDVLWVPSLVVSDFSIALDSVELDGLYFM